MAMRVPRTASGALRLSATGQGFLLGDGGARMRGVLGGQLPQAFLSQINFSQVMVDPVRDAVAVKLGPLLPALEAFARERGL